MPGFEKLDNHDFNVLIDARYGTYETNIIPEKDIDFPGYGIKYYLIPAKDGIKQKIIIRTNISSSSFRSHFDKIQKKLFTVYGDHSLIFSITGQGSTEQHITAAYANNDGTENPSVTLIDSKTTNPERFFGSQQSNRVWVVLEAFFKSFLFNPERGSHDVERLEQELPPIKVNRITTGTQSLFDGVTCGHHAFEAMHACEIISNQKPVISGADILATIRKQRYTPVRKGQKILVKTPRGTAKVKSNLLDFLGEAWSKTFSTSSDGNTPFFDYPSKGTAAQKAAYFIPTFRFLSAPLTNLVKLPTEFLVRGLAEFFHFLQTQLIALAPTNPVLQGLRTVALGLTFLCRGIFLGLSRVLRCVFSPIESAKEALKIEPKVLGGILCTLSVVISLAAYVTTAIFAAPLLFAALPSLSVTVAQPVLSALGAVGSFLTTALGAPTALAALAIVGTSFLYGVRSFFDRCFFSSSPKVVPEKTHETDSRGIRPDLSTLEVADDFDEDEVTETASRGIRSDTSTFGDDEDYSSHIGAKPV